MKRQTGSERCDTDVSFLERRRVVDAVAGDCDNEALTLEAFDDH